MFISPTCFTELYKTTNTTVKHQQYNQEMLSGSITSMRFYFIVPYVVKKEKHICAFKSNSQNCIIYVKFKKCLLWYSCELTVTILFILIFLMTFYLSFVYKSMLMKLIEFQYFQLFLFLCLPT